MSAIEIKDLCKQFRGKKNARVDALKSLTLEIAEGEIFGFLGPNGAGKSTTIKTLMGLIRPTSGSARIAGHDVSSVNARKNVGYLPENPAFYDYLTAEEYLRFVGKTFGMQPALLESRLEETLKLLELWDARKRPIRGYSKGMVQRVGLAQVLIHDPQIYILDEPMSGLDPIGRALVKQIISDLKRKGKSVFFSTHITDDVEKVCDRVGVILNGELKSVERVDTLIAAGVTGYALQVKRRDGSVEELMVKKDELYKIVDETGRSGDEIRLVEPQRKNLEDFFLDIVRKKGS